ncbi:MAG: cysteine peptidase family C39 domain-containing protein, partial [Candidatus Omnitrophica bacterium]|nr:cysteine peptidase family C39 domain-containing protein [Candidatus Omnitrophota bacterium]
MMKRGRNENLEEQKNFGPEVEKKEFKSGFKAWIRVVAFILVAVFIPQEMAQAIQYDWGVLYNKPSTFAPNYLQNIPQIDIPLTIKNILLDISGKPVNAIQLSPELTLTLSKPLEMSKQRVEEIYNWLKGKPCGSKALFDYLQFKGKKVSEEDIAVMALTVDILNNVLQPEGNPDVIKNSLFALSTASEYFGEKLYPAKIEKSKVSELSSSLAPFIAHLLNDHYVLVTRISEGKVYLLDNHQEKSLAQDQFINTFSGYGLVTDDKIQNRLCELLSVGEAKVVLGAYDYYDPYGAEPGGALWYQENASAIANGEFSQLPTPSETAASYLPNLVEFTQDYNLAAGSNMSLNSNINNIFDSPLANEALNDPYGAEPGGALWYQENDYAITQGQFSQLPTPSETASQYYSGLNDFVAGYNASAGTDLGYNSQIVDLFDSPLYQPHDANLAVNNALFDNPLASPVTQNPYDLRDQYLLNNPGADLEAGTPGGFLEQFAVDPMGATSSITSQQAAEYTRTFAALDPATLAPGGIGSYLQQNNNLFTDNNKYLFDNPLANPVSGTKGITANPLGNNNLTKPAAQAAITQNPYDLVNKYLLNNPGADLEAGTPGGFLEQFAVDPMG